MADVGPQAGQGGESAGHDTMRADEPPWPPDVSFADSVKVFTRIGLLSFGGPAAQIAVMHRILVDELKWFGEARFLRALNFCMLLPGPEATQLATYAGWSLFGVRGGIAAGLLFVLPGAVVVLALAAFYVAFGNVALVAALFFGIKAAVLAIVVEALLRVARRALKGAGDWIIAAAAFVALFVVGLPFPLVIATAALVGFLRASRHGAATGASVNWRSTARTMAAWLMIWLAPVAVLAATLGSDHVLVQVGLFFSKLAVVTFGGAYAVLTYMAQQAVETHGWLTAGEMIDGLGLAETTPGPLILVTEFVGYIAGYREAGGVWGGLAAALITLWVTFVPSYLFIFAGAPYIERLAGMPRLSGALAAITAAVVGVIASLALWFALHVLFARIGEGPTGLAAMPWPEWSSLDLAALALVIVAAGLVFWLRTGIVATLAISAVLGAGWTMLV